MNWFNPFRLIVPSSDKPHLVASRSYLSYGKAELQDKLDRNPYSYLHVIHPAGSKTASAKRGTEAYYRLVRERFDEFIRKGWFQESQEECLAIYRQTTETHECTGIIGTLSIEGIRDGRLKLHEQTLEKRERLFAKYLGIVGCHAEPILCVYPDEPETGAKMTVAMQDWTRSHAADMDFSTTDRIRHTIWILDHETSRTFAHRMEAIPSLYLADGHHRVASSLRLADQQPNAAGKRHVLTYAVPESELIIRGYHREVSMANWTAADWENAFDQCRQNWSWKRTPLGHNGPNHPGEIHVHHQDESWVLQWIGAESSEVDASRLQHELFEKVLGITDARNDVRLRYLPGTFNTEALTERAAQNAGCAIFELHPVLSSQLKATADAGGFLPPKSTWIEPKLRSGLFVHQID